MALTHTVTYVASFTGQSFPAGTVAGPVMASLLQGTTVVQNIALDATGTVNFTSVPDGSYVLSVQAMAADTVTPLGAAYTAPVTVSDPGVTINIPTGGTVTIA